MDAARPRLVAEPQLVLRHPTPRISARRRLASALPNRPFRPPHENSARHTSLSACTPHVLHFRSSCHRTLRTFRQGMERGRLMARPDSREPRTFFRSVSCLSARDSTSRGERRNADVSRLQGRISTRKKAAIGSRVALSIFSLSPLTATASPRSPSTPVSSFVNSKNHIS